MGSPFVGARTRETPSGLTYAMTRTRSFTGSALAPTSITDLRTINGQSAPWSSVFTALAGTVPAHWLYATPAGRQRLQQLDSLGRVTSISYPGTTTLPTTSFVYDADGRIASVTVAPNGGGTPRVTTNTYDAFLPGYLSTTQDPVGNVTTYDQRDQDGRILDVELPDFATVPRSHVSTTYDENGNITSVTVPPATSLPSTHTFTDTPVDLLESYTPPQVSTATSGDDPELATLATSYTYNGDRQVTTVDAPEGTGYQAVTHEYDTYGRLSSRFDPLSGVAATYGYLLNGSGVTTNQVATITTSDGVSITNTFDGFLKTRTQWASASVAGSVNWTYDNFFRPATLQVSNAPNVTFSYDSDSLYDGTSSPLFSVRRDATGSSLDGLPYASTLGTVSDAWTYDGFGAQASYTVKTSDGTVLYAMSGTGVDGSPLSRDANGRITSMVEYINGVTHSWAITLRRAEPPRERDRGRDQHDVRVRPEREPYRRSTVRPSGRSMRRTGWSPSCRLVRARGRWATRTMVTSSRSSGRSDVCFDVRPLVQSPERPGHRDRGCERRVHHRRPQPARRKGGGERASDGERGAAVRRAGARRRRAGWLEQRAVDVRLRH